MENWPKIEILNLRRKKEFLSKPFIPGKCIFPLLDITLQLMVQSVKALDKSGEHCQHFNNVFLHLSDTKIIVVIFVGPDIVINDR